MQLVCQQKIVGTLSTNTVVSLTRVWLVCVASPGHRHSPWASLCQSTWPTISSALRCDSIIKIHPALLKGVAHGPVAGSPCTLCAGLNYNVTTFFAASTISSAVMLRSALHHICVFLVRLVASLHLACGKPACGRQGACGQVSGLKTGTDLG